MKGGAGLDRNITGPKNLLGSFHESRGAHMTGGFCDQGYKGHVVSSVY